MTPFKSPAASPLPLHFCWRYTQGCVGTSGRFWKLLGTLPTWSPALIFPDTAPQDSRVHLPDQVPLSSRTSLVILRKLSEGVSIQIREGSRFGCIVGSQTATHGGLLSYSLLILTFTPALAPHSNPFMKKEEELRDLSIAG